MMSGKVRPAGVIVLISTLMMLLPGCWDNHELDSTFIITGVALDETDDPGRIGITLQIGQAKRESTGTNKGSTGENSAILMNTTSSSMMSALIEFNRNSDHRLLLHHNQVLLFGTALAEHGIKKNLDLFMRDQQARLEVPVVVVDGRAEEALAAKLTQERISGIFLAGMFDDLSKTSVKNRVRLIDFVTGLLEETTSAMVPIVKVVGAADRQEIKLTGMAVFKGDRMMGRLSNEEVIGYIWSMGKVKQCNMRTKNSLGQAVFHVTKLDSKRDVTLRQDGGVGVSLSIDAALDIGELRGFDKMMPKELMPYLINLAQEEIQRKITDTFKVVQKLNADIYGFGTSVYHKYPKEWISMKDRWDTIFPDIDFRVRVKVRIPGIGQIVQSLEMEENME